MDNLSHEFGMYESEAVKSMFSQGLKFIASCTEILHWVIQNPDEADTQASRMGSVKDQEEIIKMINMLLMLITHTRDLHKEMKDMLLSKNKAEMCKIIIANNDKFVKELKAYVDANAPKPPYGNIGPFQFGMN